MCLYVVLAFMDYCPRYSMDVDVARGERPKQLWQSDTIFEGRNVSSLLWAPNGSTIAAIDTNTIAFVSVESGRVVGRVQGAHSPLVHTDQEDAPMCAVSWLADSRGVVTGGTDKLLKVWRNPDSS